MRQAPKKKGIDDKSRWIYGIRVIREYLNAKPQEIQTLHMLSSLKDIEIKKLAELTHVPIHYETLAFFSSLGQGGVHQGIAASLRPFLYMKLHALLEKRADL